MCLFCNSLSESEDDEGAYSDEDDVGIDDDEDMEDIDEYGPDLYKDDDDRRRFMSLHKTGERPRTDSFSIDCKHFLKSSEREFSLSVQKKDKETWSVLKSGSCSKMDVETMPPDVSPAVDRHDSSCADK